MFLNKLFKSKPEEEKEKNSKGEVIANSQAEETISGEVADVSLSKKSVRKSKYDKVSKTLQKRKKRTPRLSHVVKSYHPEKVDLSKKVNLYDVIIKPIITEKAANLSEGNVYTFLVSKDATKHTVSDAIELLYKIRPKKVRISKNPAKRKRLRIPTRQREFGTTKEKKKAYVFLRDGDKINLT